MKKNNDLIEQIVQEVATSSMSSEIEAGQANNYSPELIDAINKVFALFRVNYHNQFYSAYTDTDLLNQAKRLWLDTLCYFSEKQILQGAKKIISTSEYLPTLNRMLECCEMSDGNSELPSSEKAYKEACTAGSPKSSVKWSHIAVYYAGEETGWYKLRNDATSLSYPIFLENYRRICSEISQGKKMPSLVPAIKKDKIESKLSNEQLIIKLKMLKKELGFD
tara:strand:- start:18 stop:680 length:663 start_codon:yes stop_codon:yes gene_type:complete